MKGRFRRSRGGGGLTRKPVSRRGAARSAAPRWHRPFSIFLSIAASILITVLTADALVLDSFIEDFESRTAGSSINGVEFWAVNTGSISNAMVQTSVTPGGTGKALEVTGDEDLVSLSRTASYGGATPTWVRFLIRPGIGGERRDTPSTGIAAVSFDYTGTVLAADGTSWVETGKTYTPGAWWEVIYKLNFNSHTYDLYMRPVNTSNLDFTPVKSDLRFIDPGRNSLESFTVEGAYSTTMSDDTFVDELTVTYIDRIELVTAAQTLIEDKASEVYTLQLQNSLGEPQRAPYDVTLELSSTSSDGEFSLKAQPWTPVTQTIIPKDSSSATFYYRDSRVGKPTLSINEFPDQGWTDALQQQNVIEAFDHFDVTVFSPQIAGVPFNVTLSARDGEGNINMSYAGTVQLKAKYVSPTSGTAQLTPTETASFVDGVAEVMVTYTDAGLIAVSAVDSEESEIEGLSGQIAVMPKALELETAGTQTVGAPFALTVRAVNAAGNVTPNYAGSVTLGVQAVSPMDGVGVLAPTSILGSGFSSGTAAVQLTYPSWGSLTILGTDATAPSVSGQSLLLMFHPKTMKLEITTPPAPRTFFYTLEPFQVKISALAADGTPIPNYQGTVQITAPAALGLPAAYTFLASEGGTHTFEVSPNGAGDFTVQMTDTASAIASESKPVAVQQAYLEVLSTSGAVGSGAEVPILLVDKDGKVITSENSITVSLKLIEGNPNGSSSTTNHRVTLTNGRATITVYNQEEESVTVTPTSPFGIQSKSGVITFGRFSTKGVGFLLWREIRQPNQPGKPH